MLLPLIYKKINAYGIMTSMCPYVSLLIAFDPNLTFIKLDIKVYKPPHYHTNITATNMMAMQSFGGEAILKFFNVTFSVIVDL
jgi:hypothetical protein